jgi:adsorption protein B
VVHGIYCDEFAEYQTKDIPARRILGGFLPSNGVGTAYGRAALERLAQAEGNRVFEPACLTEDYENGFRLHRLGCPQVFVPVTRRNGEFIATREYFPRHWRAAIRQRTRWVMGIALQGWERHGWTGGWRQMYWFWRDRKGLVGNPLSLAANAIFLYGAATWFLCRMAGASWGLAGAAAPLPLARELLRATLGLQAIHACVRIGCVWRIYGPAFAAWAPLRAVAGNWINAAATFRALWLYGRARIRGQPLVWLKTEHSYPSRAALLGRRRSLEEVLAGSGYVTPQDLEDASRARPAGLGIGECLIRLGRLSEQDLCEAMSLQQGIPLGPVRPEEVNRRVARSLPAHIVQAWRVLPFKVADGALFLALADPPGEEMQAAVRPFTRLEVRFQLVTMSNFEELIQRLL